MIEIAGTSEEPLQDVSYDIISNIRSLTNQVGYVSHTYFDEAKDIFTTNWFNCYDVELAPGTNQVVMHCKFATGRKVTVTNVYVLRLDLKTNAPVFALEFPAPNREISGDQVSVRGRVDDITLKITGEVSVGSETRTIRGIIERNGRCWLEHVPLLAKTNSLRITLTDTVGNSTVTNLILVKSDDEIVINPVPPRQLYQMQVTVTGRVTPYNRTLWVNGVKAIVSQDGNWSADGVSLSDEGVAIFDVFASKSPGGAPFQNTNSDTLIRSVSSVSVSTNFNATGMILNTSQPTHGTFRVHLTGTTGQSFILQDSTNLIDWVSITTNLDSSETFDFYDTNVVKYGSRFFRVIPVR